MQVCDRCFRIDSQRHLKITRDQGIPVARIDQPKFDMGIAPEELGSDIRQFNRYDRRAYLAVTNIDIQMQIRNRGICSLLDSEINIQYTQKSRRYAAGSNHQRCGLLLGGCRLRWRWWRKNFSH